MLTKLFSGAQSSQAGLEEATSGLNTNSATYQLCDLGQSLNFFNFNLLHL